MAKGWKFESFRHALSAKGIKTSKRKARPVSKSKKRKKNSFLKFNGSGRFFVEKEEGAGVFKETRLVNEGRELRTRDVQAKKEEVLEKMEDRIKEGNMRPEMRERFLDEDFKTEAEFFLNGSQDKDMFDQNIRRKLDSFMNMNSLKFGPIIPERGDSRGDRRSFQNQEGPPVLAVPVQERSRFQAQTGRLTRKEEVLLGRIRGGR